MNVNSPSPAEKWERPRVEYFGPAAVQTRMYALGLAVTVKPAAYVFAAALRAYHRWFPEEFQRASFSVADRLFTVVPPIRGTRLESIKLPHCAAEWVTAPADPGNGVTVIYFYGGAFLDGGLRSHRRLVSQISEASGARVFAVDYRLTPRHSIADAMSDCLDAYRLALDSGVAPGAIVLAGGYLAAVAAIRIREVGLPVPAGQVLLSAQTSSPTGETATRVEHPDGLFPVAFRRFVNEVVLTENGTRPCSAALDHNLRGLGSCRRSLRLGARPSSKIDNEPRYAQADQVWAVQEHLRDK